MALSKEWLETYRKEAQRANKRLQRLEKMSNETGYASVKEWAYRSAMEDIQHLSGGNRTRFRMPPKNLPKDPDALRELETELRRSEKAIQEFVDLPSSTRKGIQEIYEKRAAKFSKDFDAPMSGEDLRNVFETGLWQMLNSEFGSETTKKAIGLIKEQKANLKKLREQSKAIRLKVDKNDPDLIAAQINDMLGRNRTNVRLLTKYLMSE